MNSEVKKINIQQSIFNIQCSRGEKLEADLVCIACGGYPKSSMFDWLKELGHSVEDPVPSLFTFNMPGNSITKLMGVSVEKARVKVMGTRLEEEGPLLITHWGLSGPAILRLSAWGARELLATNYRFQVSVNWIPQFTEQQMAEECRRLRFEIASQKIGSRNVFGLPQRLWEYLLDLSEVNKDIRWADLPALKQNKLVKNLSTCVFNIEGKTTFKEEFVTAGGIRLNEINPATMESKRLPHLFFAGEIMDVDGITGGFNFQHAWTSGWVAAAGIVQVASSQKS
jgi:predicted Rossmann fold flavoprotein